MSQDVNRFPITIGKIYLEVSHSLSKAERTSFYESSIKLVRKGQTYLTLCNIRISVDLISI